MNDLAKPDVNEALNEVDMTYDELIGIVDDTQTAVMGEIDELIKSINDNVQNMTNDSIRETLTRLSLHSYTFSSIKDKSAFKANIAESIRKEAYAKAFGAASGTVGQKDSQALLSISAQTIAESIHDLTSALFKTKLDEIHRVIDTLKTVLMSRMSEAKLVSNDTQI